MGNIRIVGTGKASETRVIDVDTGEDVPGYIASIDWSARFTDGQVFATIVYVDPEIDVEVSKEEILDNSGIVPIRVDND